MSNTWLNVRFGEYHLQWAYDSWFPEYSYNPYQATARKTDKNWKWFEFYEFKNPFWR